jgi:polysaccharide biosynthesis/export protein
MTKKHSLRWASLLLAAAVLGGFAAGPEKDQQDRERTEVDYRIGPRDMIEIKVFGQDKLTTTARVTADGKITFPMVGEVLVDGLTAPELERKLVQLLGEFYKQPEVSVLIKEHQSRQVSILGAVAKTTFVELVGRQTLIEAITAAGGITKDAAREIMITRTLGDGLTTPIRIAIDDLMSDPKLNIILQPGDIVYVQVDHEVSIYVTGQVKAAGVLKVMRSRMPTLTQALAQAGGFTERARTGKVLVRRTDETGQEKVFEIDANEIYKGKKKDFPLRENDVVFVPETII